MSARSLVSKKTKAAFDPPAAPHLMLRGGRITKFKGMVASYAPLLASVSVIALAAALSPTLVRAQTVPPAAPCNFTAAPIATCQGNLATGVGSPAADTFTTINVNTLTANIAPASGDYGISLTNTNSDAIINSDTGTYSISTNGGNSIGLIADSTGLNAVSTINSTGNISAIGVNAGGIFANSPLGVASIMSSGNIYTQNFGIIARGYYAANVVSSGIISTSENNGPGITAQANIATVTSTGDISTQGGFSDGIYSKYSILATVTSTGDISTQGIAARGIYIDSGSLASVESTGDISTRGDGADGISAFSLSGAASVISTGDISTGDALAGTGDDALGLYAGSGDGGTASINSAGKVATLGDRATAIYARATTGTATVMVSGDISTQGREAVGLSAYSRDNVTTVTSTGDISTQGIAAHGIYAHSPNRAANVTSTGDITLIGNGSSGIRAVGDTHSTVTSIGNIETQAAGYTIGIYSLGGSHNSTVSSVGNISGNHFLGIVSRGRVSYVNSTGNISSTYAGIASRSGPVSFIYSEGDISTTGGDFDLPGFFLGYGAGGSGIYTVGGANIVTSTGNISTQGNHSSGIFGLGRSNSIESTGNISTLGNDAHGISARSYDGEANIVTTGDITISGQDGSGILALADTVAGHDITIDIFGGVVQGGSGAGTAVTLVGGDYNMVTNHGDLSALSGNAIIGGASDDNIWNYGTITGNIDLDGGTNSFHNHAGGIFNMGATVNVGAGNAFINDGTINPGGLGTIATTAITGIFTQNASGVFVVDLNQDTNAADLITVDGTAEVNGTVLPNLISPVTADATGQVDILTATGVVFNNGVTVNDTAVADYTLLFPDTNTMALGFVIDFTPLLTGLTPNQNAVGAYFNGALAAGGGGLTPLFNFLTGVPDLQTYVAFLDRLHPEAYLINGLTAIGGSTAFAQAVLDCDSKTRRNTLSSANDDDTTNRNCFWAEAFGGTRDWDRHRTNIGHDTDFWGLRGGFEMALGGNVAGGLSFSFEDINADTNNPADSDGQHYQVAGSLRTNVGGIDIAGIIHGGWGDFDVTRPINIPTPGLVANGKQDITTVGARLEFATKLLDGPVTIEPVLGVGVVRVESGSIREAGGGAASLSVSGFDETFFYLNPAIHIQGNVQVDETTTLSPFARFGVTIYDDERLDTTSRMAGAPAGLAPFRTIADLDQVVFEAAAGLDLTVTNGVAATLGYDGKFSENARTHQGSLRVKVKF